MYCLAILATFCSPPERGREVSLGPPNQSIIYDSMEAAIVLGTFGFVKAINYCQTPDLDQGLSLGVDFVLPL